MSLQVFVSAATGYIAKQVQVAKICCQRKIQPVANRSLVPHERQTLRSVAQIRPMPLQSERQPANVLATPRINDVQILSHERGTVQGSSHTADDDEFDTRAAQRSQRLFKIRHVLALGLPETNGRNLSTNRAAF